MIFARPTLLFSLLLLLGGVAIKANELKITTTQELIDFSNNVSKEKSYSGTTVYLDSDIDFAPSLSQQFEPIGKENTISFKGFFDGQGHTISNLVMNSSLQFLGFFGYTTGATIKNIILDDSCSFTNSYSSNNPTIGSIYGYCTSCSIESIVNMADVSFAGSSGGLGVGGIVGKLLGSSTIKNCVNYGPVTNSGTSTSEYGIGGIAGLCGSEGAKSIQNCANYGAIANNGVSEKLYIGGIVGESFYGSVIIENCVSGGKIVNSKQGSASNYVGGLVGYIPTETTITNCFWTSDVGYDNACGHNPGSLTNTNSSLKELTKETVDGLNEYTEKNSTWNKWLLNTNNSTIHFKVNDCKGFNISNKAILLPDLAATGNNTFKGWFTDLGYSTPLTSYEVSEGMALYGLYGVVVTVIFDGNGGTPSQQSKSVLFNKAYGALSSAMRTGYTFAGWFTSKEEGEGERVTEDDIVMIGSDHTLYAKWSINNYTITFIFNNGKENDVRTLSFNETIIYPENLTKEGFIFNGWSPKPEEMSAENVTVTAQWSINNYTITFIFNNGKENEVRTINFNETIVFPENLTKEGHIFNGWSPMPETMPAEDITVTAQWIEITPELVEIVFEKKDMKEEEIREIVKEYTQEEFTIEKIETDENTGETKVIVKFIDVETAQSFIEAVNLSSGTKNIIKKVGPIHESQGNSSTLFNPNVLFYSLL